MASNDGPSQLGGQMKSAQGSVYEAIGSVTGSADWKNSGAQLRTEGDAEVKAAQAQAYVEGAADRLQGSVNNVIGAVTGDREKQNAAQLQHDKGQLKQELNKPQ